MTKIAGWTLALAAMVGTAAGQEGPKRLVWEKSPRQAAKRAAGEGKLLMVVHLSGEFDDPERT